MRVTRVSIGICLAALSLSGCVEKPVIAAKYEAENCRRVALYDQATGARINGAEDIAIDRMGEQVFISAYNRHAAEQAVKQRAFAIPEGGVYAISIKTLLENDSNILTIPPIAAANEIPGGLRPHGISYDATAKEVVFINRSYQRINNRWTMTPRIERIGAGGEAFVGQSEIAPCAANDIHASASGTLASFDHASCDWRAGVEDTFSLGRSGVVQDGNILFQGAKFANGITRTLDGTLILAATREKALIIMDETSGKLTVKKKISLPGGPDNLTIAQDGSVVAALHPSLVKMGLHRKLNIGRSPSRIVKIGTAPNGAIGASDIEFLYDDSAALQFAAATVAVEWGNVLIAGSVLDDGLLVCEKS